MRDCEFYVESRRSCSAGIEHLRIRCSLTGTVCLICEDARQVGWMARAQSDRLKCDRRNWALDYGAKRDTDRRDVEDEDHKMETDFWRETH